ncbi:MAG: hypothetical protein Q9226_006302 [Calogaya cf. arnoldii]
MAAAQQDLSDRRVEIESRATVSATPSVLFHLKGLERVEDMNAFEADRLSTFNLGSD